MLLGPLFFRFFDTTTELHLLGAPRAVGQSETTYASEQGFASSLRSSRQFFYASMSGLGASSHHPWLCTRVWLLGLFSFEQLTNGFESLGCAHARGVRTSLGGARKAQSPAWSSAVRARNLTGERVEDGGVRLPRVAKVLARDCDSRLISLACPLVAAEAESTAGAHGKELDASCQQRQGN